MDMPKNMETWASTLNSAQQMFTTNTIPAICIIEDTVRWPMCKHNVNAEEGRDRVCRLESRHDEPAFGAPTIDELLGRKT